MHSALCQLSDRKCSCHFSQVSYAPAPLSCRHLVLGSVCVIRRYKKYHFTSHETMFCTLSALLLLFFPKIWCFHIQFSNFFSLYFASFFHDACGKVFMAGIITSHRQKFAAWFYIHSSESSECLCTYTSRVVSRGVCSLFHMNVGGTCQVIRSTSNLVSTRSFTERSKKVQV